MTRKQVTPNLASKALRIAMPIAITAACFFILIEKTTLPPLSDLWALTKAIPPLNWLAALAATGLSFWALGRYDALAHRHLRTGFDNRTASRAGMASIAFSQTVGFGILTGSFARWRLLPGLSPLQAAQLTGFVGITFLSALALICGLALLATAEAMHAALIGAALPFAVLLLALVCFVYPQWRIGKLTLKLPSLRALAALTFWTFVDIAAAGTALWLLLPTGHDLSLIALLPAYFMALGLAIVSSSPGGAGPLELALLALLPTTPATSLVAGLLAFRIVYYALPAVLSGIVLLWPHLLNKSQSRSQSTSRGATAVRRLRGAMGLTGLTSTETEAGQLGEQSRPAATLPHDRPQAETGIILQNGGHVLAGGLNEMAILDSPQLSVAFFDPLHGHMDEVPGVLSRHAKNRNTVPCFYKCSAKMALEARKQGWCVLRIAADAIVNPQTYSDAGSSHRQLRRKLRHAEKAGLRIELLTNALPVDEMEQVDGIWTAQHGHALGTTMGRFEPGYVEQQHVVTARQNDRLIAFMTFHHCADEWALDLVRMSADAPDGTGHAMVRTAIDAAKDAGLSRLSLAAVADHGLAHKVDKGLRRFKTCFAPHWEARYIAAPNRSALALAILEMIRLVHRPNALKPAVQLRRAPLRPDTEQDAIAPTERDDIDAGHIDYEENAIALRRLA